MSNGLYLPSMLHSSSFWIYRETELDDQPARFMREALCLCRLTPSILFLIWP